MNWKSNIQLICLIFCVLCSPEELLVNDVLKTLVVSSGNAKLKTAKVSAIKPQDSCWCLWRQNLDNCKTLFYFQSRKRNIEGDQIFFKSGRSGLIVWLTTGINVLQKIKQTSTTKNQTRWRKFIKKDVTLDWNCMCYWNQIIHQAVP